MLRAYSELNPHALQILPKVRGDVEPFEVAWLQRSCSQAKAKPDQTPKAPHSPELAAQHSLHRRTAGLLLSAGPASKGHSNRVTCEVISVSKNYL